MAAVPTRTPGRGHPRYDISNRHANPGPQSKLNLDAEIRILLCDIVTQNQVQPSETASDKFNLRPVGTMPLIMIGESPFAVLNYGNRLVGKHSMATAASMQSNARFRACKAPSRLVRSGLARGPILPRVTYQHLLHRSHCDPTNGSGVPTTAEKMPSHGV